MSDKPDVLLGEELPQSDVSIIENEIINGYRDFSVTVDGKTINLRVLEPSNMEQEKISLEYTNKYNQLLDQKQLKLWDQIVLDLKERGIWTDKDDTKVDDITEEIGEVLKKYLKLVGSDLKDSPVVETLKKQYFALKKEMDRFSEKRSQYYSNSIESKANEHAIKHKIVLCLLEKKEDGSFAPMFNNIDLLNELRNRVLVNKILKECLSFWAGIRQEYLDNAPEDDLIFGGKGLHTLLVDSAGVSSTKSTKKGAKGSLTKS